MGKNNLPPSVVDEAIKVGKSCYNMGIIGAYVDLVIGPEKHIDGSYKNPNNKEGLNKMRDSCFDELVAPRIRNAGGTPEDVKFIRDESKKPRDRSKKDVER